MREVWVQAVNLWCRIFLTCSCFRLSNPYTISRCHFWPGQKNEERTLALPELWQTTQNSSALNNHALFTSRVISLLLLMEEILQHPGCNPVESLHWGICRRRRAFHVPFIYTYIRIYRYTDAYKLSSYFYKFPSINKYHISNMWVNNFSLWVRYSNP